MRVRSWLMGLGVVLAAPLHAEEALPIRDAVQEVISHGSVAHTSDWRQASLELQLGYGFTSERNNFDTDTEELGVGVPAGSGSMFRLGVRHATVRATSSSDNIGRTPFTQAAQSTRYEVMAGYALGLVEGRSMTLASPTFPDVENATFLWLGAHYNLLDASWVPQLKNPPPALPGQQVENATFNLELGLRWHIYFPHNLGVYVEGMQIRPLGGAGDLHYWAYYSGGILWAFGGN